MRDRLRTDCAWGGERPLAALLGATLERNYGAKDSGLYGSLIYMLDAVVRVLFFR